MGTSPPKLPPLPGAAIPGPYLEGSPYVSWALFSRAAGLLGLEALRGPRAAQRWWGRLLAGDGGVSGCQAGPLEEGPRGGGVLDARTGGKSSLRAKG